MNRLDLSFFFHNCIHVYAINDAEIQCKAFKPDKNLALSEDTGLKKRKNAVESDPQKTRSGIEAEEEVE